VRFTEIPGHVEQVSPELAALGVKSYRAELDALNTREKIARGKAGLESLWGSFDKHVASIVLPMMDQGCDDDEIRVRVGNLQAILRLRRQWEGEARRNRANAKITTGPPLQKNTIDGAGILQEVYEFIGRFVAYPSEEAHVAHTLWLAHCHAMEAWESTPRLAFLSPEPGSGKTRARNIRAASAESG
jgi:hypothetical protein